MSSAPSASDDEDLPRPFGSYLLLHAFARGGMGEVYLGKAGAIAGLERTCVIKKLRADLVGEREYLARFLDEAGIVIKLSHANIGQVFEVGLVAGEYFLAMEHIAGRDVRALLDRARQRGVKLPTGAMLALVCDVLAALDYAHRFRHPTTGEPMHLVHRDVSPQNVLVSWEGEVKLIDFGLAASRLKVERTAPNVVMGKMAYMAPEHARGDAVDARADQFAVGVMLYELLAGERYYEGMGAHDIWQVAGKGTFRPARWDTIDAEIRAILERVLHADPLCRYSSCAELREAMATLQQRRWPGDAMRTLRELMATLFADDMERDRATLQRFATVNLASFREQGYVPPRPTAGFATARIATPTSPTRQQSGAFGPQPPTQETAQEVPLLPGLADSTDRVRLVPEPTAPPTPAWAQNLAVATPPEGERVDADSVLLPIHKATPHRIVLLAAAAAIVVAVVVAIIVARIPSGTAGPAPVPRAVDSSGSAAPTPPPVPPVVTTAATPARADKSPQTEEPALVPLAPPPHHQGDSTRDPKGEFDSRRPQKAELNSSSVKPARGDKAHPSKGTTATSSSVAGPDGPRETTRPVSGKAAESVTELWNRLLYSCTERSSSCDGLVKKGATLGKERVFAESEREIRACAAQCPRP